MPSKPVVQHECSRCTRTWYTDPPKAGEKEVEAKLELKLILGALIKQVAFDGMCEGCTKTVTSLIEQIAKEIKKSSPRRRAKEKGADAPSDPPVGKEAAGAPSPTEAVSPPTSVALSGAVADASGRRLPVGAVRPIR